MAPRTPSRTGGLPNSHWNYNRTANLDSRDPTISTSCLCGVTFCYSPPQRRFPVRTPHKWVGHITHQMWCTTFGAVVPLARVCEGGGLDLGMANLNGHEAGNGGYSQGEPAAELGTSSTRSASDFDPTFCRRSRPLAQYLIQKTPLPLGRSKTPRCFTSRLLAMLSVRSEAHISSNAQMFHLLAHFEALCASSRTRVTRRLFPLGHEAQEGFKAKSKCPAEPYSGDAALIRPLVERPRLEADECGCFGHGQ